MDIFIGIYKIIFPLEVYQMNLPIPPIRSTYSDILICIII